MPEKSRPDRGAITITPADGYQYGDDHAWDAKEQGRELVTQLDDLIKGLRGDHRDRPSQDD